MKKGIIEATFTRPVKLYAVSLNDALDILIMQRKQLLLGDIRALQNIKETITSNWAGLKLDEFMPREIERFQILQGGAVYSKLLALLDNISGSLSLFMSKRNFLDLYKTDFMDKLVESLRKKRFRAMFLLDEDLDIDIEKEVEVKQLGTTYMNDFILIDGKTLFYYLNSPSSTDEKTVLWTTLSSFAKMFQNIFEIHWKALYTKQPPETAEYQNFITMKENVIRLFSICGIKHGKNVITGLSGVQHRFDVLLQTDTKNTAIDFIFSQKPIDTLQILPFYIKTYDLKGRISNSILFVNSKLDDDAKKFTQEHNINIKILKL